MATLTTPIEETTQAGEQRREEEEEEEEEDEIEEIEPVRVKHVEDAVAEGEEKTEAEVGVVVIKYRGVYEGEVKGGIPHGKGRLVSINNDVFVGTWMNGKMEGAIRIEYSNGEVFEGAFVANRRFGEGKHSYPSGACFEGSYYADKRHGPGKYLSDTDLYGHQNIYVRQYEYGKRTEEYEIFSEFALLCEVPGFGYGVWVSDDGIRYEGNHEHGLKHGEGKMTWPDGKQWVGEFVENLRHGMGMLREVDNTYWYTRYDHGVLVEKFESDYMNFRNLEHYDEGGGLSQRQ